MLTLPTTYLSLIQIFAPHFSSLVWQHAQLLLIGAILVPGRRTVTAVLRILGLSAERQFQAYRSPALGEVFSPPRPFPRAAGRVHGVKVRDVPVSRTPY